MQQQGDRPGRGGRPSLLAPGEQAAPERQGILSSLDGNLAKPPAPPRARAPRTRRWLWGGAAAVGAVVVGGALFLLAEGDSEGDAEHAPTVVAAAPAATNPPAHAPVAAPAPASAPVSARADLEAALSGAAPASTPALPAAGAPAPAGTATPAVPAAAAVPDTAVPAGPIPNPLADMAPPPTKAERRKAAHEREEARHAGDKRTAEKRAAEKRADAKRADEKRAAEKRAADKHAKDKHAKDKQKGRVQDSDVVLLTALMNHMDPKARKATPAEQLETCKRYNTAGEEQCRIRVCKTAGSKEPACKKAPAAAPPAT